MHKDRITELALANGFKLKEQPDGAMALNPYVFDFARALLADKGAEIEALKAENMALQEGLRDIADTPPFEAILDPQRAARVASEVMAQGVRPS